MSRLVCLPLSFAPPSVRGILSGLLACHAAYNAIRRNPPPPDGGAAGVTMSLIRHVSVSVTPTYRNAPRCTHCSRVIAHAQHILVGYEVNERNTM